tara:strand:+ start:281 stop:604 length:324 start_codon:yes stop_codon:yes gene_type:complete
MTKEFQRGLPGINEMDFIDNYNKPLTEYKFDEDKKIKETLKYIQTTYNKHYSMGSIQSTEFIVDSGHIEGFCIGNIIKYAQRYGKKVGESKNDNLKKIIHYALIAMR